MFHNPDAYPEMIIASANDQLRELEHARRARELREQRRGQRKAWTRLFTRRTG